MLFIWGPQIRRRSKFSRVVMEADEAKRAEEAKRVRNDEEAAANAEV